jgi:hypothetical protein
MGLEAPVPITAVIAAYNREHLIRRAIESCLAQERPPEEIVVVDDGSSDATRAVIESFGARVRCFTQENRGASEARNRGAREARGEWIAILDSDDYWMREHLARMERAIRATGGACGVYFGDMWCDEPTGQGRLWELSGFSIEGDHQVIPDASAWALLARQPMMLQSSVFRREAYLGVGGMRPEYRVRGDTYLFFKLCLGRPACAVAGLGARMTSEGGAERVTTAHHRSSLDFWTSTYRMYREILDGDWVLTKPQRQVVSSRLAAAHLRLARFSLRDGRPLGAAAHVLRALGSSPGRVIEGLGRRLFAPRGD